MAQFFKPIRVALFSFLAFPLCAFAGTAWVDGEQRDLCREASVSNLINWCFYGNTFCGNEII